MRGLPSQLSGIRRHLRPQTRTMSSNKTSTLSMDSTYKMRSGYEMPMLGYGVGRCAFLLRPLLSSMDCPAQATCFRIVGLHTLSFGECCIRMTNKSEHRTRLGIE